MVYSLLKLYARFALKIYCRKVVINKPHYLKEKGPLLIAANHPNSFLDGIILTTLFDNDIYSLARGDAFKGKKTNKTLRWLKLLPVYRTSEGVENLEHNYTTFSACLEVFKEGDNVLIFSEGRCENEWHLRPLRKGTARLATSAWSAGMPLKVLPLGFNYSSFKKFGKDIHLQFGEIFREEVIAGHETDGKQYQYFNAELRKQLKSLVYQFPAEDDEKRKQHFPEDVKPTERILLFLPALTGILLHYPLYLFARVITDLKYKDSSHYDSVITSILMLAYPVYLLLLAAIAALFSWIAFFIVLVISPLSLLSLSRLNYHL